MGQLAARYGKAYTKPTNRNKILATAKAEARTIAGCVAFAVNSNSGVEFYGVKAFGKGKALDDNPTWDMYVMDFEEEIEVEEAKEVKDISPHSVLPVHHLMDSEQEKSETGELNRNVNLRFLTLCDRYTLRFTIQFW